MTRAVLLCGSSRLLAGIAAGLEAYPDLRTTQARTWPDASRLLAEGTPDVLIFDLSAPGETHILPLLLARPNLQIIGLDATANQAILVSGQQARLVTLNEIQEIIGETP